MSRVMMKADYEELEKPEIGLAVERIERATRMFWYGPWEVPGVLMSFAQGLTITLSALALAWPVFTPAPGGGIPWETILMVAFLVVSAVYSIYSETKLYRMKEENITVLAAPLRLQNFLFNYAHVSLAAKDIRLYAMQDRLSGLLEKTDRKVENFRTRARSCAPSPAACAARSRRPSPAWPTWPWACAPWPACSRWAASCRWPAPSRSLRRACACSSTPCSTSACRARTARNTSISSARATTRTSTATRRTARCRWISPATGRSCVKTWASATPARRSGRCAG